MEKYLGNKSTLMPLIEAFITQRAPGARRISDLFAGTNNVSRYFRARGWETSSCDVNRFSYVLAHTYLRTIRPPEFSGLLPTSHIHGNRVSTIWSEFKKAKVRYGQLYLPSSEADGFEERFAALANALGHLQGIGESNTTPGWITNYYTRWGGERAAYSSVRGTTGVRNYFSHQNALFLDGVLATLRQWWQQKMLSLGELFALLTSVIEEVVITANVNGTFHDFNRDKIWPNANQAFKLRMPIIGLAETASELANADAFEAAKHFESHDVCYLDPPYNFRQYSAYYHLLNLIPAVPFIEDLEEYFAMLQHVRGQNPTDNYTSDFCFRDRFIPSMRGLIETVNAEHVVLSYYSGRNHWNHWSSVEEPTDEGRHAIESLFADKELFANYEVVPAINVRQNYQSRVGEQKGLVNELLFYGRRTRKNRDRSFKPEMEPLDSNARWGLCEVFGHLRPTRVQQPKDESCVLA